MFEIKDKTGRTIRLTKERWKHIVNSHPIISNNIEEIKKTLQGPLLITKDEYDKQVYFYYKFYKNFKDKKTFLIIVVKYLNGSGFIITSFYTDKIVGMK